MLPRLVLWRCIVLAKRSVAPCRAILQHYRCDTPHHAIPFAVRFALPQNGATPPLAPLRYPNDNTSRDDCAKAQQKTSPNEFCDKIATSIARYEKYYYGCWASKAKRLGASMIDESHCKGSAAEAPGHAKH